MFKKMKSRFRNRTLVAAGVLLCALALSIENRELAPAVVSAASPVKSSQSPSTEAQTYEGMITDTRCEAKHSAAIGMTAADCTRVCVRDGERFALVDGDALYVLEGEPAALKRAAGERVRILGTLKRQKISVASVSPTL